MATPIYIAACVKERIVKFPGQPDKNLVIIVKGLKILILTKHYWRPIKTTLSPSAGAKK
jgi:hypothetical protein